MSTQEASLPTPDPDLLTRLRSEFALSVDHDGRITWADRLAEALLGAAVGIRLPDLTDPAAADKVGALLNTCRLSAVDGWEVPLTVRGVPSPVTIKAEPIPSGALIVGRLLRRDDEPAPGHPATAMNELASLHRETERQQRELLRRGEELTRLNRDLDDSERGVMALHQEVDEKSDSLRRITEVKSRVVANVSHEFRTPLNAIIGLSRMLLSGVDGDVTSEQQKQVSFILRSAESLAELVNDLLDLSKIEAGKVGLRPNRFQVPALFAALRGMFRPLQAVSDVLLTFDSDDDLGELDTDEGKVSQILKNLVVNAMKFTERGSVRVAATAGPEGTVQFTVSDTGIGIRDEDQERIFEEFAQIDHPLQRKVKGTGLGLSLSRRLAEILGGTLTVKSSPGFGSTFTLSVPRLHPEVQEMARLAVRNAAPQPGKPPILVVEDDRQTLFLYEKYLSHSGFQIVPARTVEEARLALARITPIAIVLDVMLEGETSWALLAELKSHPATRDVPILVVTVTNREQKARALGADEFVIKPLDREWLTRKLSALARRRGPITRILVIDDDEVARYMVTRLLSNTSYQVIEAADGEAGVQLARQHRPQVIFLDFVLPGMTAFDVLDELKLDSATRNIPVIIHTSHSLADDERRRLGDDAAAILPKQNLNREVALGRIRDVLVKSGLAVSEDPRGA